MSDYTLLASDCPPCKDCSKIARSAAGTVVVVGVRVTDPAALAALGVGPGEAAAEITEVRYDADHRPLGPAEPSAPTDVYVARRDLAVSVAAPLDVWLADHTERLLA